MKKSHLTKLLPVALAMMLTSPIFAATPNGSATQAYSTVNFALPSHTYIQADDTTYTITATVANNEHTSLTLSSVIPVFKVYTNNPGQDLYIYAKTPIDGDTPAMGLYKNSDQYALAFANKTAGHKGTTTGVSNLTGGADPTLALNPNVIGVPFGLAVTNPEGLAGTATENATPVANQIHYNLTEGSYVFTITTGTAPMTGTFSTHDSHGTYETTLYFATTSGA